MSLSDHFCQVFFRSFLIFCVDLDLLLFFPCLQGMLSRAILLQNHISVALISWLHTYCSLCNIKWQNEEKRRVDNTVCLFGLYSCCLHCFPENLDFGIYFDFIGISKPTHWYSLHLSFRLRSRNGDRSDLWAPSSFQESQCWTKTEKFPRGTSLSAD